MFCCAHTPHIFSTNNICTQLIDFYVFVCLGHNYINILQTKVSSVLMHTSRILTQSGGLVIQSHGGQFCLSTIEGLGQLITCG